jgi:UDP-N-acetylmuramate-alanine ligase
MHHPDARYIGDLSQVSAYLVGRMVSGDVLLVLSAGDADQVSTDVLKQLKEGSRKSD